MIYLDNAATTFPKPPQVVSDTLEALTDYSANPGRSGHALSLRAARKVLECRENIARLFNIDDAMRIAFCFNCTDALNQAILGTLNHGDHVITTALEHNSVLRVLKPLERDGEITLTVLAPDESGAVPVSAYMAAVRPTTRLVCTTYASNVTGAIQHVKPIGMLCRRAGIRYLVDAAQTAGYLPIDVKMLNCDLLAFPGHKGLYGPQGTGGLYIAPGVSLRPLRRGGTGSSSENVIQPEELPERFESGTLNLPGIAGLCAGVDFITRNSKRIQLDEAALMSRMLEGLRAIKGVRILGPEEAVARVGVVGFNVRDLSSGMVADLLDQNYSIAVRGGLHCAPYCHVHYGTLEQGAARASVGAFNTLEDVDTLLNAVEDIADEYQ